MKAFFGVQNRGDLHSRMDSKWFYAGQKQIFPEVSKNYLRYYHHTLSHQNDLQSVRLLIDSDLGWLLHHPRVRLTRQSPCPNLKKPSLRARPESRRILSRRRTGQSSKYENTLTIIYCQILFPKHF